MGHPSTYENIEVGETVVHELTHRVTGSKELPFEGSPSDQVTMLQEKDYEHQFGPNVSAPVFEKPTGVILSSTQLAAFYKKCLKKQHARGGGGGGSNPLPTNTGTETLWQCSVHLDGWNEDPYTATSCSGVWSFMYGFRGFIL